MNDNQRLSDDERYLERLWRKIEELEARIKAIEQAAYTLRG